MRKWWKGQQRKRVSKGEESMSEVRHWEHKERLEQGVEILPGSGIVGTKLSTWLEDESGRRVRPYEVYLAYRDGTATGYFVKYRYGADLPESFPLSGKVMAVDPVAGTVRVGKQDMLLEDFHKFYEVD